MSNLNIDYNRGVTKKVHPQTMVAVFMYKDTPGVFLNAYGTEVSPDLAKECGFNTDELLKEKLKRERISQVTAMIEAELANDQGGTRQLVEDINGFKTINIGLDRYIVEDPDGNNLTVTPLPLDTATKLLRQLNPSFEEKPKQQPPIIWTKPEPQPEEQTVTTLEKPVAKKASKTKADKQT